MNLTSDILKRKIVTAVLIMVSIAAFAALGDGDKKTMTIIEHQRSLLSARNFTTNNFKSFSLKSGYSYRGSTIFNMPAIDNNKFIMLNTVVTYQRGNSTYILPLKKKVLLDKIKFNPAP